MSYQKSFTEIENKFWSEFKPKLNEAEKVEDTKKLFSKTIANLLAEIDPEINAKYGEFESDFMILEDGYSVSEKVSENEVFKGLLIISDLPKIIERFAEAASHRMVHQLNKHEKAQDGKKIIH